MRKFTIAEILQATGGSLYCGSAESGILGIATDSRKAKAGDLFFALKGEVTDGHLYLDGVLRGGCRSLVVSDPEKIPKEAFLQTSEEPDVIVVADTTRALQELAAYYLAMLPLQHKIAVTGSVGKTSTRDLLYYAIRNHCKTARSMKNFNNGFGLPLSILEFPPDTEVAVLEMGMDDFGEIERLADLVRPDIALITNIGISHIEKLGSREGILRAKMEVTTYFTPKDTLIVNADCDLLTPAYTAGDYHLVCVGSEPQDDFVVSDIRDFGDKGIKYCLRRKDKTYEITSPLPGAHNAGNQALVIAAAELLGITPEEAAASMQEAELTGNRLKIRQASGIKVIDDSYNASPVSVKSAIETLTATAGKRKIAILGDMFELGGESRGAHLAVGAFAGQKNLDLLIAIGKDAAYYAEGAAAHMDAAKIQYFPDKNEFLTHLPGLLAAGDVVLVKASRGMALEEIADRMLAAQEAADSEADR